MIRFSAPQDHLQLAKLWNRCFGDSIAYALDFLRRSQAFAKTLYWCEQEKICAMLTLADVTIPENDNTLRGLYLYAVATAPEYRGRGYASELTRQAAGWAKESGYDFIVTVPASKSLHSFYHHLGFDQPIVVDLVHWIQSENIEQECLSSSSIEPLPQEEFLRIRGEQKYLIQPSEAFLRYIFDDLAMENENNLEMFKICSREVQGYAVCYHRGNYGIIKETIPNRSGPEKFFSVLSEHKQWQNLWAVLPGNDAPLGERLEYARLMNLSGKDVPSNLWAGLLLDYFVEDYLSK